MDQTSPRKSSLASSKTSVPSPLIVPKAFKSPEMYTSPTDSIMSPVSKDLLARTKSKKSSALIQEHHKVQVQDLKETIRHKPNKVKAVKTSIAVTSEEHEHQENQDNLDEISKEKDDAKPLIFADTFGSNSGNDSETSGPETPAKEVVDNGNGYALIFWLDTEVRELSNYGKNLVSGMFSGFCDRDAKDALSKLLQMGTVAEYHNEFEMDINRVIGISESLLKSFYIFRLKVALQIELLRARPTTLEEAFSLARITEAHFEDE
uniref:Retrotransposon gag domain-containing protein n=1 Tax=Tanacetum cinerariifolium TaxID=118510 RepID=A0A6L2JAS9_TANCI|nr:hypothetical protein [Tanacetum cinerariifolium]